MVGARCAGSPTAMLLARQGYRVLLVDRASFPSDTMSTHCVTPPGVARLAGWGLRERVAASGCPPISRMTLDLGDFALTGSPPAIDGVADQYCVRRTVLDAILVEAAVEAGAELRERFVVRELLLEDGRVAGVQGVGRDGTEVTERARLVVGADGLHSVVARAVEASTYAERPSLTCFSYAYWSGVALDGAEFHLRDGRAIFAFPTNGGLACIGMEWPVAEARAFRADVEGNYLQTLDLAPGLADRVRAGSREGRFVATADLPNLFRKPHGPGWALVGDAGCHKDPYLAQGMADAFRDAELLAAAVDDGLSGRRPLEEALADYELRRNRAAMPAYELNARLAHLRLPVGMRRRLRSLVGDQEAIDGFLGVLAGTVPVAEFFSPHADGLLAGSSRRVPPSAAPPPPVPSCQGADMAQPEADQFAPSQHRRFTP
ncbi:MAG: NAD(P)/FAD-dependent oxidoreductase [Acidimicrobiia bacterium]